MPLELKNERTVTNGRQLACRKAPWCIRGARALDGSD